MKVAEFNLTPSKPSISFRDENLQLDICQEFLQVDPFDNQFLAGCKSWDLEMRTKGIDEYHKLTPDELLPMSFDFIIHDKHFCGMGIIVSYGIIGYCAHCGYSEYDLHIVGTSMLYVE